MGEPTRYDNCWHCRTRMPLRELRAHNREVHGGLPRSAATEKAIVTTDPKHSSTSWDIAKVYVEQALKFLNGPNAPTNALGAIGNLSEALKYIDFAQRGI